MTEKNVNSVQKIFCVVRIKGSVGVSKEIKDTLVMLRLQRVNHSVIVPDNSSYRGMLQKAKDCATWGEIDEKTLGALIYKRGRLDGEKRVEEKQARELAKKIIAGDVQAAKELKPVFRLSPPSKGYESIRKPYPKGTTGYRGEKINMLVKRMI